MTDSVQKDRENDLIEGLGEVTDTLLKEQALNRASDDQNARSDHDIGKVSGEGVNRVFAKMTESVQKDQKSDRKEVLGEETNTLLKEKDLNRAPSGPEPRTREATSDQGGAQQRIGYRGPITRQMTRNS